MDETKKPMDETKKPMDETKKPTDETKKPTLMSLRQRTNITTKRLAYVADVSLTEAYMVEIGGFVDRETAQKVITAFSWLSGTHYTLDDIRIQNVPSSQRSSQKSHGQGL
jgi:hypothetical protein